MSKTRKVLALLVTVVLAVGSLTGCSNSNSGGGGGGGAANTNPLGLVTEGKLTIGSDCDYPPFIWMDEDTQSPVGFEFELMQAMATELELELVYLPPQNFETLIASVQTGGIMDLAVSSLTITDERLESVNFCTPYFEANQAIVVMSGSTYTSYADLEGKVVGAQSGTTGEDWAIENLKAAEVKAYNQTSEGLAALQAGEIEALIFDQPVADWQIQNSYSDCKIIEVIPTAEQYGFAVSKDNPALETAVNDALQKLVESGVYAEIHARYFDFEPVFK